MKHKVFIGDKFYDVEVGSIIYPFGITGKLNEILLFTSRTDTKVFGKIVGFNDGTVTMEIVDIKVNGVSQILKEDKEPIVAMEEECNEEESCGELNLEALTKKELIAFIKENELNINTTKKNKATLLDEIMGVLFPEV